ncbi:MAG: PAS domain S-box protein [Christensenellales bacterium]|jgi:diguanylate cyclase (GGDEF)-like protein/PAS domain S-box-containing protein
MHELLFQSTETQPTPGYAYHRILLDDQGEPRDFEILEANEVFLEMTGLSGCVGECITDVFPGILTEPFDWIQAFGQVARQGITLETRQRLVAWEKQLLVKAYSPQKDYFVTLISSLPMGTLEESYLDHCFNLSLDLLCIIDNEGKWVRANDRWREVLGADESQLRGGGYLAWVHPDDHEKTRAAFSSLKEKKAFSSLANRCFSKKDGQYRVFDWCAAVDTSHYFIAGRDITLEMQKKESIEELVRISQEFLHTCCEHVDDNRIADAAARICGADRVIFNRYDSTSGEYRVAAVSGDDEQAERMIRCLTLYDSKWIDSRQQKRESERAEYDNVRQMISGSLPEIAIADLEACCPAGKVVALDIVGGQKKLGELILFSRPDGTLREEQFLQIYTQMVGQLLYRVHMERAVSSSETYLKEAHKLAGLGRWEWDHATSRVKLEENIYSVCGLFEGLLDVSYRAALERVHPDDRKRVFLEDLEHQKDGSPYETTYRVWDDQGALRWIQENGCTILDEDGVALRTVGSIQDISKLKNTEETIETLLYENQTIFNGAQDALFLIRVQPDGQHKLTRYNEAFARKTGIGEDGPQARAYDSLWVEKYSKSFAAQFSACIAAGVPLTYEQELGLPAGERIWKITLTPVVREGRVEHIVGCGQDVTKQRRAERGLREHMDFNEKLVDLLALQGTTAEEYLHAVLNHALAFTRSGRGFILLWDQAENRPGIGVCSDDDGSLAQSGRFLLECGILDEVVNTKKPLMVDNSRKYTFEDGEQRQETELLRVFIMPVVENGVLVAVVGVADKKEDYGAEDNMRLQLLIKNVWARAQRERSDDLLRREKEMLQTMLHSIDDGILATDQNGEILLINEQAKRLTGWAGEEAIGQPLHEVFKVIRDRTREPFKYPIEMVLHSGRTVTLNKDSILLSREGREYGISESASPIQGKDGRVSGVVLAFRDITLEKQKLNDIEYLNYHDALTGLYNRTFFEKEVRRLDETSNLPLSVVMADVNGLKLTNDAFGHAFGDKLLQKAAQVMRECCRQDDVIARIGGDEFVLLLPKTDEQSAGRVVARINEYCSKMQVGSVALSISFGWETKSHEEEEMAAVQKKAEDRMYRRKLFDSPSMRGRTITAITQTLYETHEREELHSRRVSHICELMAQELGMNDREVKELTTAGLLHDIGKIAIDGRILNKLGPLSEDEWRDIRRHPEIGYRILGSVNDLSDIANCVLAHHERWDGMGYPQRLKGEETLLPARIIALADAFDAMISERPYGRVHTQEEAMLELCKNSGTQLDPYLVEVFQRLFEKGTFNFEALGSKRP